VAEAQALRGDAAAAEASAARALKLRPGASANALDWHLQAGRNLEARGRMPWAVREWEHVLRHARPESESAIDAARFLAELHHDLQQDRQAAETLDLLAKACTRRSDQWRVVGSGGTESITLGMLRSRMNYFWACHWKAQGDRVRQRASLDSALATHAYDIEVLIECYRVPDSPAEYRSHIRKLLDKRLCELREQIADCGNTVGAAQPCNEFAWLAANTEGDLDEALAFSKRSLALVGQHGAYYDTLARVHAARGEYAEALKHQTTAARLLPHTRAVQKQLEALRGKVEGEKREEGVKGVKGGNSLLRLRRPDSRAIGGTLQAPWNIREKSSQL
jgi:tetratricopeptide (TPR) repeat protein